MNVRSLFFRPLLWLLTLALLAAAFHLKDPHLMPVRKQALATLILLSGVAGLCFFRLPRGFQRRMGIFLLAVALLTALYAEASFRFHVHSVLTQESDEMRQLGGHFIAGFDDWQTVRILAEKGLVGGIYISRRNILAETRESLRAHICELQTLRRKAGLPELLVAADQEGGIVSHLSPPLPRREALSALLISESNRDERAYAAGVAHGRDLLGVGVNINFSPVVDLKSGRERDRFDFHSRIEERAISDDPHTVRSIAQAYAQGLQSQGVVATLKHFPGLGGVAADTHHFSAEHPVPVAVLRTRDWLPFRDISAQTGAVIMLGHVRVPELDRHTPVSFSRAVVQNVIREAWRHQGVLITDDLSMGAAYNHGLCKATIGALDAGVDLLLLSYDHEKIYDALFCAAAGLRQGRLDAAQLEQSRMRLAALRARSANTCP